MSVTLEQVEKLREKASVSFEEAKDALERSDGDILDALILLEHEGKTAAPQGGSYSTGYIAAQSAGTDDAEKTRWESFKDFCAKIGKFIAKWIRISCENYLDVNKNGSTQFSLPVLAVILLLILAFWIVLPLLLVSLFFGFKYRFRGREMGRDSINNAIDKTADAFEKAVRN